MPQQDAYKYNEGESEDSFITNNMSSYYKFNGGNRDIGTIAALGGRKAYRRQRAAYQERQRAYNAELQQRAQEYRKRDLGYMQHDEDFQREQSVKALENSYNSGHRERTRQDQYDAEMQTALAGLNQQSNEANGANGKAMARRGVLGGSEDAGNQARIQAGYDAGASSAAATALARKNQAHQADLDQYHNLRRALLSGDPVSAERFSTMAENDARRADRNSTLNDFSTAYSDLSGAGHRDTSQAIGGGLTSIGQSYTVDQDARGNGRQGNPMWNWAQYGQGSHSGSGGNNNLDWG
jgi:hypothetical protein